MRKIFLIFTLVVSSFFIFNTNVKADTIDLNISQEGTNLFGWWFQQLRTASLEQVPKNYKYYVILYNPNSNNDSGFRIYYFDELDDYFYINNNVLQLTSSFYSPKESYYVGTKFYSAYGSTININIDLSLDPFYYYFLDTNYPNFIYKGESDILFTYGDCTYTLKNNKKVRGLYDYYLANENSCILEGEEPEDPHLEEKEILSSFYSIVINKISELSNYVFNNYILLFVIGIFIFIFIFEIIFRRLL